MPKQTIGEFLAIQRKAKGLTQQEVADMLGISNKTLSSWESGRSYPDILTLPALAEIYGVTVDEILSGERMAPDKEAGEISEKSQKRLLKNAANRYSVKCTTLVGIGIGGIGLLALALCLGFVATWLFILFAVLSLLTEVTVIILFVVFEKSALMIEEKRSRYSLLIKRMTYKAAFKIICVAGVLFLCLAAVTYVGKGLTAMGTVILITALIPIVLSAIFLGWLSCRGREFYTAEESAACSRNKKLSLKIFSVGGALAVILFVTAYVISSIPFTHIEKIISLPKDEFVHRVQSVEISADDAENYGIKTNSDDDFSNYFVDIQAALSKPIQMSFSEKHEIVYHIEGNLYLRYLIDYENNSRCYILYIPDLSGSLEVCVFYGTVLFREKNQFRHKYPDPTAEDLLSGMECDEVFFILDHDVKAVDSPTISGPGNYYNYYFSEYSIELFDNRLTLSFRKTQNYPFITMIGFGGILVDIAVCICLYHKKRKTK